MVTVNSLRTRHPFITIALQPSPFPVCKPLLRPKPPPSPPPHYLSPYHTDSKDLTDASTGTESYTTSVVPRSTLAIPLHKASRAFTSKGLPGSPVKRSTIDWGRRRKKSLCEGKRKRSKGVSVENLLEICEKRQSQVVKWSGKSDYQSRPAIYKLKPSNHLRRLPNICASSEEISLIGREITVRSQRKAVG